MHFMHIYFYIIIYLCGCAHAVAPVLIFNYQIHISWAPPESSPCICDIVHGYNCGVSSWLLPRFLLSDIFT